MATLNALVRWLCSTPPRLRIVVISTAADIVAAAIAIGWQADLLQPTDEDCAALRREMAADLQAIDLSDLTANLDPVRREFTQELCEVILTHDPVFLQQSPAYLDRVLDRARAGCVLTLNFPQRRLRSLLYGFLLAARQRDIPWFDIRDAAPGDIGAPPSAWQPDHLFQPGEAEPCRMALERVLGTGDGA